MKPNTNYTRYEYLTQEARVQLSPGSILKECTCLCCQEKRVEEKRRNAEANEFAYLSWNGDIHND